MAPPVLDHHRSVLVGGYLCRRAARRRHAEWAAVRSEEHAERGERADGVLDQFIVLGSADGETMEPADGHPDPMQPALTSGLQIDPKLVLPDWAPPLGLAADLSFHAVPSLTLVADLLLFSPPYTIALPPALGLSGCIAFGYWVWIERCYRFNHFYPYPLFAIMSTTQRIG